MLNQKQYLFRLPRLFFVAKPALFGLSLVDKVLRGYVFLVLSKSFEVLFHVFYFYLAVELNENLLEVLLVNFGWMPLQTLDILLELKHASQMVP